MYGAPVKAEQPVFLSVQCACLMNGAALGINAPRVGIGRCSMLQCDMFGTHVCWPCIWNSGTRVCAVLTYPGHVYGTQVLGYVRYSRMLAMYMELRYAGIAVLTYPGHVYGTQVPGYVRYSRILAMYMELRYPDMCGTHVYGTQVPGYVRYSRIWNSGTHVCHSTPCGWLC
jgi:hypothetical protein